jgi:DNA-binding SARP family transcriptional activator/TolB-like protein
VPPALEIHTFGRFRVFVDGAEVEEQSWTRKKAKVLLKLLAIAPRHEAHREQLIESLWPDTSPDAGLNNLHKLIHALRRTLEPNLRQGAASRFLLTQDQVVALAPAPAVWIDLDEFETLAAEGLQGGRTEPLEAALALSQGDLLQEDMYDDWASLRREQARLLLHKVIDRLASAWEASDPRKATQLLQRLVASNPLNEDAQRRLMILYGAMGQRHLGLEQFRVLTETLRAELGASPEPATVEVHERLLAGPAAVIPKAEAAPALPAARPRRMVTVFIIAAVVLLAAGALYLATRKTDSVPRPASLAIVPLRGGAGPDMEVVAEGVTEGLINSTSRLPGIRVMARATMFTFKGRSDALAIGRELKVTSVLSGRIVRQTNGWTLAIELIDTTDGARLWGRQFFAMPDALDTLQQSAGSELASILQGTPRQADPPPLARPSRDPEAYQLYLKGRYFSNESLV